MFVGILVGVFVGVSAGVGVQARIVTWFVVAPDTERVPSMPLALILSAKTWSLEVQAGAVSSTLPVQVSVPLPLAPSVVTGLPLWVQGTAVGVPPVQVGKSGHGTVFATARLVMLLLGSRFRTEKVHANMLPAATDPTGQVLVSAIPTGSKTPSVPALLLLAKVVVVRDVLLG